MKKRKSSRCDIVSTRENDCCSRAAAVIRSGGIVGIPTETAYGLAVDARNPAALDELYFIKKRPADKPILVLVADQRMINSLVQRTPTIYTHLQKKFWPGPLTLIFPARSTLPVQLTGGSQTIGIRISSNLWATRICAAAGKAITATSANLSGETPARSAEELVAAFGDALDLIVDDGRIEHQLHSTVVCEEGGTLHLIRAGQIDFQSIESVIRAPDRQDPGTQITTT